MALHVKVKRVSIPGRMVVHPEPHAYCQVPCPICGKEDESILLSDIRSRGRTSLESAYCRRCEHRYFRKLPSAEWYQSFYRQNWDVAGRQSLAQGGALRRAARRLPGARKLWRVLRNPAAAVGLRPEARLDPRTRFQLIPLLQGIVFGDGSYFLPQPRMKKILEVGCGFGMNLLSLRHLGFDVWGVEASAHRVKACRQLGLNVMECEITNLAPTQSQAPFDLVFSAHVLEHIFDISEHIRQLAALIRPDGYLYIQVPHPTVGERLVDQCHFAPHIHGFSPRSLALLLLQHGLVPVRTQIDNNLQMVARRSEPEKHTLLYEQTFQPRDLFEVFNGLGAEQRRDLRLVWDQAHIRIQRMSDGQPVYTRKLNFNVVELPGLQEMDFSLEYEGDGPSFPIHFDYANGPEPPVWVK